MLILQIALMLHFECIQGFIIEVQNPLISKRFSRIKTIEKSLNIQIKLSNDELTEFGSNDIDDEAEEDGPSMKALLDAQEGAPDEFAIMKEVRVYHSFIGDYRFSFRAISYPTPYTSSLYR
jgi:hypothetical protein